MDKFRLNEYNSRISQLTDELQTVNKQHAWISFLRLGVFLLFMIAFTWLFIKNQQLGGILGAVLVVLFLWLLKKHKRLEDQKNCLEGKLKVNETEKACCEGNFSSFDPGEAFVDINHPYSYDVDLFGKGSLFQYLNRTITFLGKQKLAAWLLETPLENVRIKENQEAIKELTEKLDFRQEFLTIGELFKPQKNELDAILQWLRVPSFFKKKRAIRILLIAVPLINISALILSIVGTIHVQWVFMLVLVTLAMIGFRLQVFNRYYQLVSNCHQHIKKMSRLFPLIENEVAQAEKLKNESVKLIKDGIPASSQISKLTRLLDALDNRNNIFIGVILNGLFLWDWQYLLQIEKWKATHQLDFEKWMECISTYDALISLANLSYNNPEFTFPEVREDVFILKMENAAHPLLDSKIRVANNFDLNHKQRYTIVTGANMAGKSTFLRTVAVNLILAGAGAAVCADKMEFYPLPLFSSMRNEDSLMKNESYFFAELKRLQRITKELDKGEKLFIILDEILRGTNSEDKRKGSIGFVKKITEKQAHGLVATHDLELARLAEQQPDTFKALCFEVGFENNELQFDYTLQVGVTKNMNASFLMHRMGIIDG